MEEEYYIDGFYKYDSGDLLFAGKAVFNKDFTLLKEEKDSYSYPVDGWSWFDTLQQACDAFNLDINDYTKEEEEPHVI